MWRVAVFLILAEVAAADWDTAIVSPSSRVRREAVEDAAHSYPEQAWKVPILVAMLKDDDPGVREVAGATLVGWGKRGLAAISRELGKKDGTPRRWALDLVNSIVQLKMGIVSFDPGLSSWGLSRKLTPEQRRGGAIASLFFHGYDPAYDVRFSLLADTCTDPDRRVRELAAAALAILGWGYAKDYGVASTKELRVLRDLLADKNPPARLLGIGFAGAVQAVDEGSLDALRALDASEAHAMLLDLGVVRDPSVKPAADHAALKALFGRVDAGKELRAELLMSPVAERYLRLGKAAKPYGIRALKLADTAREYDAIELLRLALQLDPELEPQVLVVVEKGLAARGDNVNTLGYRALFAGLDASNPRVLPWFTSELKTPDRDLGKRTGRHVKLCSANEDQTYLMDWGHKRMITHRLQALGAKAAPAAPQLKKLLDHEDRMLRYLSARALRKISG